MIWFNYVLLAQFLLLSIGWLIAGDWKQALYWFGGFIVNLAATISARV